MTTGTTGTAGAAAVGPQAWSDPREEIAVGVLMANGRLAPRTFRDREEAHAWAQPGEEVVEWNLVCECDR